jgi:hypothetical protein
LFHTALSTTAALRQTSQMPPSPNGVGHKHTI